MSPVVAAPEQGHVLHLRLIEVWRRRVLLVVFALVPLTFVEVRVGGVALTGLAWFLGFVLVLPLALREPVPPGILRRLTPYLVFAGVGLLGLAVAPSLSKGAATLLQMLVPLPAFLLASAVQDRALLLRRASLLAGAGVVLGGLLTAASLASVLPAAVPLNPRPMSIALIVLTVVASIGVPRRRAVLMFAVALASTALTGGRTATAVLLLVLVLSPAWRLRTSGRLVLAALGLLAVVAVSQTQAFQERFFFGAQGDLTDALTGGAALNTAGRRELWPRLVGECNRTALLGSGPGAASELATTMTLGVLVQPHNDYLRTYCDVGLAGSVPFWLFFASAGVSGYRLARRGDQLGGAAGSLVAALLVLAVTDNPVLYTAHFMAPVGVVLGLAAAAGRDQELALPAS